MGNWHDDFYEKFKLFRKGVYGGIAISTTLFIGGGFPKIHIAEALLLKVLGAFAISLATGIANVIAPDLWKLIKRWFASTSISRWYHKRKYRKQQKKKGYGETFSQNGFDHNKKSA